MIDIFNFSFLSNRHSLVDDWQARGLSDCLTEKALKVSVPSGTS